MRLNRILLSVVLLPMALLPTRAEEPPPAEPPPDESADPVGWKKTLAEARMAASARSGYAMILVTSASKASERMEMAVMSRPVVYEKLQQEFGCVKGTLENLSREDQAKSKLAEAGVVEGPALIFIEPADGSLVDVTRVELSAWQFQKLLEDVDKGATQKRLEERVKEESGDAALRLKTGRARMRKLDLAGAGKDFEAAARTDDKKIGAQAKIGLAAVALGSRDCKTADRLLKDAQGMLVEEEEIKDFESPMAEALYLQTLSAWEQDLREDASRYAQKVMKVWPMSPWMQFLWCKGEELGWDWYEGKAVPR